MSLPIIILYGYWVLGFIGLTVAASKDESATDSIGTILAAMMMLGALWAITQVHA